MNVCQNKLEQVVYNIERTVGFSKLDTTKLIKQKLRTNDSDILAADDVYKLTLVCPITKKRLKQPARGEKCKHLECFDLESYVKIGIETLKWKCPICSNSAQIVEIKVDQYISDILKNCTENEVNITANCKWKKLAKKGIKKINNKEIVVDDNLSDNRDDDLILIGEINLKKFNFLNSSNEIIFLKEDNSKKYKSIPEKWNCIKN